MNDRELDEILDTWRVPKAPPSLRDQVRARFAERAEQRRPRARMALWAAAFGTAGFLVALTQAFPQTVKLVSTADRIPYTVDSEWVSYARDGSVRQELQITSYSRGGREVTLSQTIPGHPLQTLHLRTITAAYSLWNDLAPLLGKQVDDVNPQGLASLLASGCTTGYGHAAAGGKVAGHETILNYQAVKIQREDEGRRFTVWLAPTLACFALRETFERRQPDGSYRLGSQKHAMKVTVNSVK